MIKVLKSFRADPPLPCRAYQNEWRQMLEVMVPGECRVVECLDRNQRHRFQRAVAKVSKRFGLPATTRGTFDGNLEVYRLNYK